MVKVLGVGLLAAVMGCASFGQPRDDAALRARKQLTRELIARGEYANAFAHADELHRQRPDDAEVLVMRGIVFREKNLPVEAEADLRAAIAADAGSAEAHAALGVLLDSTRRGGEAERHHRRAVELAPRSPAHLNNLGFSLLVRRKSKEAVEVLQRAARLDPTARRVRTNLGFAYAAAGDMPRAASEFAMGATPAEAKNNLGFAYESRGDLANAYDQYVAALRLDPGCRPARQNLQHVAQRLGRAVPSELGAAAGGDVSRDVSPAVSATDSEESAP